MADGTTTPEDDRETELEEGRMPLLEHLIEFRNRLMDQALAGHPRLQEEVP